jgi:hypothetical protein
MRMAGTAQVFVRSRSFRGEMARKRAASAGRRNRGPERGSGYRHRAESSSPALRGCGPGAPAGSGALQTWKCRDERMPAKASFEPASPPLPRRRVAMNTDLVGIASPGAPQLVQRSCSEPLWKVLSTAEHARVLRRGRVMGRKTPGSSRTQTPAGTGGRRVSARRPSRTIRCVDARRAVDRPDRGPPGTGARRRCLPRAR